MSIIDGIEGWHTLKIFAIVLKSKQQFKEERKIRLEKEAQEQISLEKSQKKKKSATEKFNARYEKYQQIKNSNR